MADSVGLLSKMGIKSVAGWATAYAAVDVAVPFKSESLSLAYERIQKESLIGYGGREPSEQGNQAINGSTEHELDFNNYYGILEAAFGAAAGGVFTIEDQLEKYYWLEFEKQVSRHRFGAGMISKITISGEKGGLVELTADWLARTFDNNAAAFPGISPSTMTRVRFQDLVFRLADQGDAIQASDAVEIDQFEFTLDRTMQGDDYVARATDPTIAIVPIESDFRTTGLTIRLPRYAADAIIDWKEADTPLMADLVFTRGSETFTIELPEIRISEGFDAAIGGAGPLTIEGGFEAYRSVTGNPMYVGNEAKITIT